MIFILFILITSNWFVQLRSFEILFPADYIFNHKY